MVADIAHVVHTRTDSVTRADSIRVKRMEERSGFAYEVGLGTLQCVQRLASY